VPIRRQESLARALVQLRVNTQIPAALYEAVAAILEWAEAEGLTVERAP
jgi:type III secretion system FlhB-like substrate exporter